MKLIKELYAYREMIFSLVRRDLKGRYKGSALGFLWTFLNPLFQLCVFTVVFSVIMRNDIEDFYLFLFVALIPWIFFSTCLSGGASCILSQQDMVKKIYFPREVLPVAFTCSQFINMLLSFIIVFAALLISGKGLNFGALIYLPIIMAVEFLLALGFVMICSAITVYVRDMEYILGIVTMAWQYLTPILYPVDMVPEMLLGIFYLTPRTPVVVGYGDSLYYKQAPKLGTLIHAAILGIVLLLIGIKSFDKLKRRFVENL